MKVSLTSAGFCECIEHDCFLAASVIEMELQVEASKVNDKVTHTGMIFFKKKCKEMNKLIEYNMFVLMLICFSVRIVQTIIKISKRYYDTFKKGVLKANPPFVKVKLMAYRQDNLSIYFIILVILYNVKYNCHQ